MSSLLKCRCLSRAAQGFIKRTPLTVRNGVRLLSLNSAISNGIRRGRYVDSSPEDRTWSRSKPVPQQEERRRKPQRRESRGNSTRGRGSYDLRRQASQKRSPKKGPNGTDEDVLNKQLSRICLLSPSLYTAFIQLGRLYALAGARSMPCTSAKGLRINSPGPDSTAYKNWQLQQALK
ncbi:hypothetical protein CIHG_02399 [Coccidioides immitis H538.4]|uniref:Uncharacterized protein n=1 Tax=Coccidioides immitis H538.4 TaxID=396776 RepID=A0A0J8RHJ6_COCIT|nr:hypothetical protein CIHG_02399 [Coccidioides immitis H538.4]